MTGVGALAEGDCGLTDSSVAGDWRLPSRFELESLLNLEYDYPALSNAAGTGQWTEGDVFEGVPTSYFWSSSSYVNNPSYAWTVGLAVGEANSGNKTGTAYVWPVRDGK